jgi:lipopolysaccharide biosynthesis glycosyltransferase
MLHVSCAADARYLRHSAAMLHSVLVHSGDEPVHVHYLHGPGFPADDAELLRGMVEAAGGRLSFLEIADDRVSGLPALDPRTAPARERISATMWYRIFLPELLPDVERVLYLDVDTIVAAPLGPLWETDLSDHYVAAVSNVFQLDHLPRLSELGIDDPRDYFNSGVVLFNLERMRRDGATEQLRRYGRAHRDAPWWPDQDALNLVLGSRRVPLHPRWNCMNSVMEFPWSSYVFGLRAVAEAREAPAIRHFEGPARNKPWHYLCPTEMRGPYLAHRRHTPWPDVQLEGRTAGAMWARGVRVVRWRLVGRAARRRGRLRA